MRHGTGYGHVGQQGEGHPRRSLPGYVLSQNEREHNDANVLCMGERVLGPGLAEEIVKAWLEAEFSEEERHSRRVAKIRALEDR